MITAKYQHTKAGNFLFKLCANTTIFLCKHRILYYILACTWGIFLTLVGIFVTFGLALAKLFDPSISFYPYHWIYGVQAGGKNWGGFETGLMFVRDKERKYTSLDAHEFGHTFQNCLFGPFNIFITSLPSAIRYWYRELTPNKKHQPYDAFWAEDAASQCGEYAMKYIESKGNN